MFKTLTTKLIPAAYSRLSTVIHRPLNSKGRASWHPSSLSPVCSSPSLTMYCPPRARLKEVAKRLYNTEKNERSKKTCGVYRGGSSVSSTSWATTRTHEELIPLSLCLLTNCRPRHAFLRADWRYYGVGFNTVDRTKGLPEKEQHRFMMWGSLA